MFRKTLNKRQGYMNLVTSIPRVIGSRHDNYTNTNNYSCLCNYHGVPDIEDIDIGSLTYTDPEFSITLFEAGINPNIYHNKTPTNMILAGAPKPPIRRSKNTYFSDLLEDTDTNLLTYTDHKFLGIILKSE